jgi:hypothetical protein
MQLTQYHRYLFRVIVGAILIVWGVAGLLLGPPGDSILSMILLSAGLVFLVAGVTRWRKYGEGPEQDERSRKIGAWGISYSWLIGLFFMTALFWLDRLRLLMLSTGTALGTSVMVMTLSAVVFQVYLSRVGDVT